MKDHLSPLMVGLFHFLSVTFFLGVYSWKVQGSGLNSVI